MPTPSEPSQPSTLAERPNPSLRLLLAVVPVAAAAILGSVATLPSIPTWYAGLAKPPGTPPNGVFGPVWTVLYCAMAYAAWRLWTREPGPDRGRALGSFYVQLVLNALWSWAFFSAHSPAAGLFVIAALLVALAFAIGFAARTDRIAALLLAPYAAWVAFAAYLNAGIWWLNG